MIVENSQDFGRAVRTARKEAGLSQTQLAELCGCSQRFVSEVERGKATAELGKALGLLHALGVPLASGHDVARLDGRSEVNYAMVRIAESLDAAPRKHRPLTSYLEQTHDGS